MLVSPPRSSHPCACTASHHPAALPFAASAARRAGRVYERLLAWARKEPMNAAPVVEGFHAHYGKLLAAGRASLLETTGKTLGDFRGIVQNGPAGLPAASRL